jgi:hypothetical protein
MPLAYVAWRAGTSERVVAPVRQRWESISGLLKGSTNTGSVFTSLHLKSPVHVVRLL